MFQKALRVLLGIGLAIAILFVAYAYASMQDDIELKAARGVCIPTLTDEPMCFYSAQSLSTQQATAIAVSADGQFLANNWHETIQLWNLNTQELVRSFTGHQDWVTALTFSPDGRLLASASLDGTIRLWSLETESLLSLLDAGRVTCLAFSPGSSILAAGSRIPRWPDGATSPIGVQLWDVAAQAKRDSIGDQPISAVTFSPDGELLAAGSNKAQVWKLPSKVRRLTLNSGQLTSLAFTPDGEALITASSKIKLWQTATGELLDTFKSQSSYLSLSPDGQTLATVNGGTVNLWRLETGKLLGTLRGSSYSRVIASFGLNGEAIVTGSSDGIKLWRAQASTQPQPEDHPDQSVGAGDDPQ